MPDAKREMEPEPVSVIRTISETLTLAVDPSACQMKTVHQTRPARPTSSAMILVLDFVEKMQFVMS